MAELARIILYFSAFRQPNCALRLNVCIQTAYELHINLNLLKNDLPLVTSIKSRH